MSTESPKRKQNIYGESQKMTKFSKSQSLRTVQHQVEEIKSIEPFKHQAQVVPKSYYNMAVKTQRGNLKLQIMNKLKQQSKNHEQNISNLHASSDNHSYTFIDDTQRVVNQYGPSETANLGFWNFQKIKKFQNQSIKNYDSSLNTMPTSQNRNSRMDRLGMKNNPNSRSMSPNQNRARKQSGQQSRNLRFKTEKTYQTIQPRIHKEQGRDVNYAQLQNSNLHEDDEVEIDNFQNQTHDIPKLDEDSVDIFGQDHYHREMESNKTEQRTPQESQTTQAANKSIKIKQKPPLREPIRKRQILPISKDVAETAPKLKQESKVHKQNKIRVIKLAKQTALPAHRYNQTIEKSLHKKMKRGHNNLSGRTPLRQENLRNMKNASYLTRSTLNENNNMNFALSVLNETQELSDSAKRDNGRQNPHHELQRTRAGIKQMKSNALSLIRNFQASHYDLFIGESTTIDLVEDTQYNFRIDVNQMVHKIKITFEYIDAITMKQLGAGNYMDVYISRTNSNPTRHTCNYRDETPRSITVSSNDKGQFGVPFPKQYLYLNLISIPTKHSFYPAEILQLVIKVTKIPSRFENVPKRKELQPMTLNKFLDGIHKQVNTIVENESEQWLLMKNLNDIKKKMKQQHQQQQASSAVIDYV